MNVNCSTCLELLTPSDDLSSVPCGHVFHTPCILQWLETGKNNCPQCRTRCQEKQLRRVYFTEGVGKFIKNSVSANFSGGLIINLFESKKFQNLPLSQMPTPCKIVWILLRFNFDAQNQRRNHSKKVWTN